MTRFGAMIFAAGFGQRLRPLTEEVAKPALPFLGLPMLAFSHYFVRQLDLVQSVVNVHHCPKTVIHALDELESCSKFASDLPPIHISHELDRLLGSAGGLKFAHSQGHFKDCDHIWLFNGDAVCLMPEPLKTLHELCERHLRESALATLLVCPHPQAGKDFGAAWVNESGHIKAFGVNQPEPLQPQHYSGIMLISRAVLDLITGENIIYDALLPAIKAQDSKVLAQLNSNLLCLETGNPKDYKASQKICREILAAPSHPLKPHLESVLSAYGH